MAHALRQDSRVCSIEELHPLPGIGSHSHTVVNSSWGGGLPWGILSLLLFFVEASVPGISKLNLVGTDSLLSLRCPLFTPRDSLANR